MTLTSRSTPIPNDQQVDTAMSLRNLYFIRAGFSIVWVTLVSLSANAGGTFMAALMIIYPAWDVVGTFLDIRANKNSASLQPQYINVAISTLTTIAVGIALSKGIPQTLIVFGIWAILTGGIQLILGIKRRKLFGGQWAMILSGGQSVLGGCSFIVLSNDSTMGLTSLAGYSAFGAFYYLLSAIRLSRSINKITHEN